MSQEGLESTHLNTHSSARIFFNKCWRWPRWCLCEIIFRFAHLFICIFNSAKYFFQKQSVVAKIMYIKFSARKSQGIRKPFTQKSKSQSSRPERSFTKKSPNHIYLINIHKRLRYDIVDIKNNICIYAITYIQQFK